jgi:protocatechuate 3,4-dioxygenase beta subunit
MVSSARQAVTCFLLIFSGTLYAYSQTTTLTAKTSTASISGKVTIKGKAAAGIVVGVRLMQTSDPQPGRHKAVTDDQGNYKIVNLPPGHYQVVAVAPVYISEDEGSGKTILINKDETVENVDIALVRGGVITGRVTDSEGRPVIEEEVSLEPAEMSRGYYSMPMSVRTDDRGVYRIYGLPPGKYRVGAGMRDAFSGGRQGGLYKLTYHPAAVDINQASIIEVTEGSEATNIDITLGRALGTYSVQGRIVDGKTGQPMPNVRYGLKYFQGEYGGGSMSTGAVSNTEGEFRFENLSPGKYGVFFESPGESDWRADPVRFEVIDQDITGLIVKTSTGASVSGVVVLEGTDDKAAHANSRELYLFAGVFEDNVSVGNNHASRIQPDGSFRVHALKAGLLRFAISGEGRFQIVRIERDGIIYPKGIRIKDGEQVSGVRVILNYGSGTVRGVFKLEGGTLPPNAVMHVSLRRLGEEQDSLAPSASSPVDARGQFFMEGVIPGTYELIAAVYVINPGGPVPRGPFRSTKQQVVVTDGAVTNVTVTVNLESTPDRP